MSATNPAIYKNLLLQLWCTMFKVLLPQDWSTSHFTRFYDPGSELSETCDMSRPELLRRRILQLRSYYIQIKSLTNSRGILLYKPLGEARKIHQVYLRFKLNLSFEIPRHQILRSTCWESQITDSRIQDFDS